MIVMGLLFVEGVRTVLQDGLNQQKALIVGMSLSLAVGLQSHNVVSGFLGDPWGVAFGNSVVVGVLAAVLMSAVLEMTVSRRRRLETELEHGGSARRRCVPSRPRLPHEMGPARR